MTTALFQEETMSDEYLEYDVFTDVTSEGKEIELAVVDTFDFEDNNYVIAGLVEGDEISDEGLFIYKKKGRGADAEILHIEDPEEYSRVADAYAQM